MLIVRERGLGFMTGIGILMYFIRAVATCLIWRCQFPIHAYTLALKT